MALYVFFQDDIQSVLEGSLCSYLEGATAQGLTNAEVCRGAIALTKNAAISFGLDWTKLLNNVRYALWDNELLRDLIGELASAR